MPGNKTTSYSSVIFSDYASVLSIMRTATKQQGDLSNPRTLDFYEALEVAWTAAMLLSMELNEALHISEADAA